MHFMYTLFLKVNKKMNWIMYVNIGVMHCVNINVKHYDINTPVSQYELISKNRRFILVDEVWDNR